MQVILNVNNSRALAELAHGDCFITIDTENTQNQNIYMVVDSLGFRDRISSENGLAVEVQSGQLFVFPLDTMVKPVGAKLMVTY